ncbi:MAG: hypothetical protein IJD51_05390 [Clostridia bacterium]|nr:hypothetical protein [Clostridia bacterium]
MKSYVLNEDEVVLFRSEVIILPGGKRPEKEEASELMLTNHNIVITSKLKRLLKTVDEATAYSLSDVKVYDETVQIIRSKAIVSIYLKDSEIYVDFGKEKLAKEFCDKALRTITGFSKFVRTVKKTQKAIRETNEALDVDVVKIAKNVGTFACEVVVGVGAAKGAGKGVKAAGRVAGAVLTAKKKQEEEKKKEEEALPEGKSPALITDGKGEEDK